MARIRISWKGGELIAELRNTPTTKKLLAELPCQSVANTWGDEVYFELPFYSQLEGDAQQVVEPGTVCFWTQGRALALPFGPTPISTAGECRLASPCNILGKIVGDPAPLKSVHDGDVIRLSQ